MNPGERAEVSTHELSVVGVLRAGGWHTNREIAAAGEVAERTARHHTSRLVQLGVVDVADVYPRHRYRWSTNARNRNRGYLERLERAADALGMPW